MIRGWKCVCGHKRTEHRYRYQSNGIVSPLSPCKPCGRVREKINDFVGVYVEGDVCAYYQPQTNLQHLESKFVRSKR